MKKQATDKKQYSWDETLRTLVVALLLALFFRSFFFEPFHIPSGSMKSTLLVGDYLFVSKYTYGYSRFSFPLGLPIFEGRKMELNEPKRGDIVVFREPSNTRVDFIKRIMGVPGDKIQLKDGVVFINGKELPREKIDDYSDREGGSIKSIPRFSETLPEGKVITILKEHRYGAADDTPEYEVPAGHYFMMGDNRDNSRDSRYMHEVGFVPLENIVGRAEIIFFSTDGSSEWINPISWVKAMRLNRFFHTLN